MFFSQRDEFIGKDGNLSCVFCAQVAYLLRSQGDCAGKWELSTSVGRPIMAAVPTFLQPLWETVIMPICVERLDHLVLTVASIEKTVAFYERVLGMTAVRFGPGGNRVALRFADQKINLHEVGREFVPRAQRPTSGSGDLCFIVSDFDDVAGHLAAAGVESIDGPDQRSGALGPIRSIYFRDPDGNLIEVSTYEG